MHVIREGSAANDSAASPHPGHVTASVRSVSPAGWPVIGRRAKNLQKNNSGPTAIKMRSVLLYGWRTRRRVSKWARGVAALFILVISNNARITTVQPRRPLNPQPPILPHASIQCVKCVRSRLKTPKSFLPCGYYMSSVNDNYIGVWWILRIVHMCILHMYLINTVTTQIFNYCIIAMSLAFNGRCRNNIMLY